MGNLGSRCNSAHTSISSNTCHICLYWILLLYCLKLNNLVPICNSLSLEAGVCYPRHVISLFFRNKLKGVLKFGHKLEDWRWISWGMNYAAHGKLTDDTHNYRIVWQVLKFKLNIKEMLNRNMLKSKYGCILELNDDAFTKWIHVSGSRMLILSFS